jgi:REP element-mobilizing transposase RayT
MSRPIRLPRALYRGPNRYFLTGCTRQRQPAFELGGFAATATASLLHCADRAGFALTADCLMPDHAHALAETDRDDADMRAFWSKWRQATGFAWRQAGHPRLWQDGFWDYVLREADSSLGVAAYIVHNPVRAGLVASPHDYRWLGRRSTRSTN